MALRWGIEEKPRFIVWSLSLLTSMLILGSLGPLNVASSFTVSIVVVILSGQILYGLLKELYNEEKTSGTEEKIEQDKIKNNIIWGKKYSPILTSICIGWILTLDLVVFLFLILRDIPFPYIIAYILFANSILGYPVLWILGYKRKRDRRIKIKKINEEKEKQNAIEDYLKQLEKYEYRLPIEKVAEMFSTPTEELIQIIERKIREKLTNIRLTQDKKYIISDYAIGLKIKKKIT